MCLKYLLMCLLVVELYHVDVLKCPTPDAKPATGVSYEKKMESPLLRLSSVWLEPSCLRIILNCPLFGYTLLLGMDHENPCRTVPLF